MDLNEWQTVSWVKREAIQRARSDLHLRATLKSRVRMHVCSRMASTRSLQSSAEPEGEPESSAASFLMNSAKMRLNEALGSGRCLLSGAF